MSEDKFSIEIVRSTFDSIANEMFWLAIRTSKSPIFYETFDFSTALTNESGDTVAISIGLPLWIGVMKSIATHMLSETKKEEELFPGDILISNDPYLTGTHLNDIGLAMPIFYKDEVIAIATAKGHVNDVGGMNPGSWGPGSTEIYQEGLFIPPVKYYSRGKPNKDVIRLIINNSRIPDYLYGDLEALAAALRLADKRINELIKKYGIELIKASMESILRDGVKRAKARLGELPKGEFYAEDYLDESYVSEEPLKLSAKIKITDEEFIVDFSESPRALPAPINNTYPATLAAVGVVYVAITDPHMPFNQGLFQPLKVIAPPNTIFNVQKPYPVSVYWETMTYAADLVWKALAPFIPENLPAGHFLSVCAEIIAGVDPRTSEYFVLCEPNPGGWGAGIDKDGESALVSFADGETYSNPVEVLEIRYPVLVERCELNTYDGTGHGKFRGGFGMVKDYRLLADEAVFTTAVNRSKFPPWGVKGGWNGTTNYMVIIRDGKELMRVSRIVNFKLKKGDIVSIRSGGGGGWGDPTQRDPSLVLQDVKNGFITLQQAREIYKVAINPETLEIDWKTTKLIRETTRSVR
ncbi:MAG: hydantoinase B/oxoprolinase family protein [Candidatus Bathyarchaeia archaeon]